MHYRLYILGGYFMETNTASKSLKDFSPLIWCKFILFSLFGVFSFFINIPFPDLGQIVIGPWDW